MPPLQMFTRDSRFAAFIKAAFSDAPEEFRMCQDAFDHYSRADFQGNARFGYAIDTLKSGDITPGHKHSVEIWGSWCFLHHRITAGYEFDAQVRRDFLTCITHPPLAARILHVLYCIPETDPRYGQYGPPDLTQTEIDYLLGVVSDKMPGYDLSAVPGA